MLKFLLFFVTHLAILPYCKYVAISNLARSSLVFRSPLLWHPSILCYFLLPSNSSLSSFFHSVCRLCTSGHRQTPFQKLWLCAASCTTSSFPHSKPRSFPTVIFHYLEQKKRFKLNCSPLSQFRFIYAAVRPSPFISQFAASSDQTNLTYCNPFPKLSISAGSLEIIYLVLSGRCFAFNFQKFKLKILSVSFHLLIILWTSFRQFRWISVM